MMSSGDISQMFAAQNGMFMGQNQVAQQMSVGGFPGMHGGHAPFSYAPGAFTGPGPGGGNRFAAGAMSAAGGVASVGAMLAFDPLMSFVGGARAMGSLGSLSGVGMGLAGGMLAAAPPLLAGYAASRLIGAGVTGGQQQLGINTALNQSYNFFNPASRTGQGFTRQDAMAVGDSIRSLSHIPEMMTSVEELTKLLPKMRASGVMQGVKDVTEFQKRFKDAVGTIREMSKVLGTTMEEAEQFFAHSRSVGFLGKTSGIKNALNAQLTAGVTGMNMGQVMQMQAAGADMATSMGARRSIGAQAVTAIAQNIGLAQQQGRIAEGLVEDVTGLTGPEAAQAAAQKMAGLMVRMAQSPAGRLTMAGLVKFDESGKAVGLDQDLVQRFNEGSLSMSELKSRAANLTHAQKISWTARGADLSMSLAAQVGPGGMGRFINDIAGGKFGDEGVNLLMQRLGGLSAGEADLAQSLQGIGSDDAFSTMGRMRARESAIRERTDPKAIMQRIKTRLHSSTLGGMEQMGAGMFTAIGKAYDEFIDDLVGRHVVELSKGGADALARAFSGGSKEELKEMFAQAGGLPKAEKGFARSLRSSDLAAFFIRGDSDTGREQDAQAQHLRRLLGAKAGGARLNAGIMGGAMGQMESIAADISGFRGMGDERKFDEMREAVADRLGGYLGFKTGGDIRMAKGLLRQGNLEITDADIARVAKMDPGAGAMLRAAKHAMDGGAGKDLVSALVSGTMNGAGRDDRINIDSLAATSEGNLLSVQAAQDAVRKGLEGLKDAGLSESSIAMLSNRPGARAALKAAFEDKDIKAAIAHDPKIAVQLLKQKGHNVTEADVVALKGAVDEIGKGGSKRMQAFNAAVTAFERGEKSAGMEVIRAAAVDMSSRITGQDATVQKIAQAMRTFGTTGNSQEFGDSLEAIKGGMAELAAKAAGMGDPSELLSSAGPIGEAVRASLSLTKGLKVGQTVTSEGLLKKFGLTGNEEAEKALARLGIKGTTRLTGDQVKALQGTVAGLRASSFLAKEGQAEMGVKSDPLLDTLKDLKGALDRNTTVLAIISKNDEAIRTALNGGANGGRENGSAGADGKNQPGKKPGE